MEITRKIYTEGDIIMVSIMNNGNIFLNRPIYSLEDLEAIEGYMLYVVNAGKGFLKKELKSTEKKSILDKAKQLWYLSE